MRPRSPEQLDDAIEQMSPQEALAEYCRFDFTYFLRYIYSNVLDDFKWGWHIENFCHRLQNQQYTATIGARYHAKSFTLYGYVAWRLYRLPFESREIFYIGSNQPLAERHIGQYALPNIEMLMDLGFFEDYEWESDAKTSIKMVHRPTGHKFSCIPLGVTANLKSIHGDEVIADDLHGQETERQTATMAELDRVKSIFDNDIVSIPDPDKGKIHVVGNAVDPDDLIFTLKRRAEEAHQENEDTGESDEDQLIFDVALYPAITDGTAQEWWADGTPIWPEQYSMKQLQGRRKYNEDAFKKQWMCVPVRKTETFFAEDEIENATIPQELLDYVDKLNGPSYAFIDVGYARHPTHITVLTPDKNGILWQRDIVGKVEGLYDYFLEQVPYHQQIEICRQLCEVFNIQIFAWDATGREFESYYQMRQLPRPMMHEESHVHFNQTTKAERANILKSFFQERVDFLNPQTGQWELSPRIRILPEKRQQNQLLSVMGPDSNFESPESYMSHGDAFISLSGAAWVGKDRVTSGTLSVTTPPPQPESDGEFDDVFGDDLQDLFEGPLL